METQVSKAVHALLAFHEKTASNELVETTPNLWLVLTTKNLPKKLHIDPVLLPLTHSLHHPQRTTCVFVKDPQRVYKDLLTGVTVLGVSKLRKRYKTYQQKRMLAKQFDLFLADERVVPMLPPLLGKAFFESKR